MSVNYNTFTAKLRKAGWSSMGHGWYRHEDGGKFNLWAGVVSGGRTLELWQWFAERNVLPDTERVTMWPLKEGA